MYAFVGITGMAKMCSSKGGVPTPADALEIMEPPLLRWLYARRRPNQSFKVAFDQEIQRLYDEWDALARKVAEGTRRPADTAAYARAVAHRRRGPLPTHPAPAAVPHAGLHRGHHHRRRGADAAHPARPRPGRPADLARRGPARGWTSAQRWMTTQVPAEQRTQVRDRARRRAADVARRAEQREALRLLLDGPRRHWSLDGLTTLVYGVPKPQAGPADGRQADPGAQGGPARVLRARSTELLVGRDTGPRLPTLLLAVGADRVRTLLAG